MSDTLDFQGRIVRDETNQIKIHQGTYYGKEVVDIRWYNNGKPTQKGFRCNMNEAKTLSRALQKIVSGLDENKQEFNEDEIEE